MKNAIFKIFIGVIIVGFNSIGFAVDFDCYEIGKIYSADGWDTKRCSDYDLWVQPNNGRPPEDGYWVFSDKQVVYWRDSRPDTNYTYDRSYTTFTPVTYNASNTTSINSAGISAPLSEKYDNESSIIGTLYKEAPVQQQSSSQSGIIHDPYNGMTTGVIRNNQITNPYNGMPEGNIHSDGRITNPYNGMPEGNILSNGMISNSYNGSYQGRISN